MLIELQDPEKGTGPFQSILLFKAIAVMYFNGPSSIGALWPEEFEAMPNPAVGFALCMVSTISSPLILIIDISRVLRWNTAGTSFKMGGMSHASSMPA